MMNYDLYVKYRERFGGKIGISLHTNLMTLATADGHLYSVEKATEEELDALMRESVDSGKDILHEMFKDEEYVIHTEPEYDY